MPTVVLMHKSSTQRLGSVPGQAPANKGRTSRAEVLSRAEADALIGACSATSRTGIRNRALLTVLYRGGLRISEAVALAASRRGPGPRHHPRHGRQGRQAPHGRPGRRGHGHRRPVGRDPPGRRHPPRPAVQHPRRRPGLRPVRPGHDGPRRRQRRPRAPGPPHGLRHTHAAELVAEGVPMPVIGTASGHSSLAVTDRYLRDAAPGDVIAAMQRRQWAEPGAATARP